jgi:enoyl-CoA hydratase/carnithine racemase
MTEAGANLVEYTCRDQVALIKLNRPDKLNALNDDMVQQLSAALQRLDADPEANVGIIHGEGRAFSSGADVRQRQLRSPEELEREGGLGARAVRSMDLLTRSNNWKPVITAPHGYALGLGLSIVLDSDLVVAEEGTKFQVTETPRGLGAPKFWAQFHFRGAGAFGDEVVLTGRYFTAEEALAANIINRVAPRGTHVDVAMELALSMARLPPLSVRVTVRARRWYLSQATRDSTLHSDPLRLYLSEDFRESARAYAEKREPGPFKGR